MTLAKFEYQPVFLVGTTRSGTTLLSLMLDHHPKINFVGEFEWVFDYHGDMSDETPLSAYYAWLETNRFFHAHKIQIQKDLAFRDLVRDFFEQMNLSKGNENKIIGVQLHRHYHDVLKIWPHAKFIHIVRDGRDVCASWIRMGWQGNGWVSGQQWRRSIEEWTALREKLNCENYIEIKFENLVTNVTYELSRLTNFLGVSYEESMLRYPEDTTYAPVSASHIEKWRTKLSRKDIRLFELQALKQLEKFDYIPHFQGSRNKSPGFVWWLNFDHKLKKNLNRARRLGLGLWLSDHIARRLKIKSWRDKTQLAINEKINASLR